MKNITITALFFVCASVAFGQSIQPAGFISSSRYYKNFDDISLHFSLGEIATEALSNGDQHLSQGFLQAYYDLVPTMELKEPDLKMTVGPNPCSSTFTIEKNADVQLTASLFSLQGQQLQKYLLVSRQTTCDLTDLPAATYLLVVYQDGAQVFATTKIIKL